MGFALVPRSKRADWPVSAARLLATGGPPDLAIELPRPGGDRDILLRREPDGALATLGPLATDAALALVRLDAAGDVVKLLQIGGSELRLVGHGG